MSSLTTAQQVLAAQPFNDLVGARLTAFGDGSATLEIDIDDRHRQQFGLVHGGVLSYAADNVLTFAAGSVLGTSVVTSGLTVHYLKGAREGVLRAVGTVVSSSSRQAVCTVEIVQVASDGTETLCAVATGTVLATGGDSGSDEAVAVARRLYDAFAAADVAALLSVLEPGFVGDVSRGMPLGVGRTVASATAMIQEVWGVVFGAYDTRPEPEEYVAVGPGRVVVLGHYRGQVRGTGRRYEAAFVHDLVIRDGRIASLHQVTDTAAWHAALA